MGLFSRSSASSSSATLDKDAGPITKEILLTPRAGITVTKKWTYDEEQLEKIEQLKEVRFEWSQPPTWKRRRRSHITQC